MGSRIHREVYVRFRGEDSETCCCEAVRRRILSLQHRADSEARKAGGYHPKPGNLGFYHFAEPVTVKGHLQGCSGNHFRQLRLYAFPEWKRQERQGNRGCAGQGNH